MGRLDQIAGAMNPFLLLVAVSLVVLNLACVVNLIDWRNLPQTPAPAENQSAPMARPTASSPSPAAANPRIATPSD
jgi:hypothetical protein